jgi:hypothetical protein
MQSKKLRANEIENSIREILASEWDPIGVMSDPEWPRDEYDSYITRIYNALARGESAEYIAADLCFIEDKIMGLGAPPLSARLSVAVRLKALNISL